MIIPIASDHAGYKAKEIAKKVIEKLGHMPIDYGTHSDESVDYPDFAIHVAKKVDSGENEKGILVCGTGQGMCMTANKFPKIRAALVYSPEVAKLSREHNDANIICLPGRDLEEKQIEKIIEVWLSTKFDGGRHERRINKITSVTEQ